MPNACPKVKDNLPSLPLTGLPQNKKVNVLALLSCERPCVLGPALAQMMQYALTKSITLLLNGTAVLEKIWFC